MYRSSKSQSGKRRSREESGESRRVKKMEIIINAVRVIVSDAISLMVLAGMFSPLICAYLVREHLK